MAKSTHDRQKAPLTKGILLPRAGMLGECKMQQQLSICARTLNRGSNKTFQMKPHFHLWLQGLVIREYRDQVVNYMR